MNYREKVNQLASDGKLTVFDLVEFYESEYEESLFDEILNKIPDDGLIEVIYRFEND